ERSLSRARPRSGDRLSLDRLDRQHQAELMAVDRPHGDGMCTVAVNETRYLDDRIVVETADRTAVAHVEDVRRAVVAGDGGHQLHRHPLVAAAFDVVLRAGDGGPGLPGFRHVRGVALAPDTHPLVVRPERLGV